MSTRNPSGAIHPTILLVTWFVTGFALQRLWPLGFPGASLLRPLRFVPLMLGAALFGVSVLELRRRNTTMEHGDPTTALVTRGPYAISRNPMYLALILFLVAFALDSGSVWFLILTLGFWGGVQWLTVVREEAYLERQFGEEYLRYKCAVRRWL